MINALNSSFHDSVKELTSSLEEKLESAFSKIPTVPVCSNKDNSMSLRHNEDNSSGTGHNEDNSSDPRQNMENSIGTRKRKNCSDAQKLGSTRSSSSAYTNHENDCEENDKISIFASEQLDNYMKQLVQPPTPHAPSKALDSQQDLWADVVQDYEDKETFGSEISPPLASSAKIMFTKKLGPEKLKDRLENAKIPSNCKFMSVKLCNRPIWSRKDQNRSNDVSLQKIQTSFIKSNVHILNLAESLSEAAKKSADGTTAVVDFNQL